MSFQAYLDNIQAKTGKRPDEIVALVRGQGLSKPGEIVAWLKQELGLGHGHAMAIVALTKGQDQPRRSSTEKLDAYFSGAKARWRPAFDRIAAEAREFGSDVEVSPATTYLSLVRQGRKFAIVQAVADRLDLGLKLKGEPAGGRREPAGAWNAMVTHRVRIHDDGELDDEVLGWLREAYARA